jgi:NAD(P)-dependent dehydrogenase (short-subunit alcohol dehydrogenase family)
MNNRFAGKTVIVTGASDGIGHRTAERFYEEGANVVLADIQDEKGEALAAQLGERAVFKHCDITSEADLEAVVALAEERFGGLDAVAHAAASAGSTKPYDQISVEEWDFGHALLLRAPMLVIKTAVPAMRRRGGGSIVLFSSAAVTNYRKTNPPMYTVMKSAVVALARFAALLYADDMIRVNVVIPGAVPTPISQKMAGYDQETADAMTPLMLDTWFRRTQPLPKPGSPDYLAEAVMFFASDQSQWITGADLRVDGGLSLERMLPVSEYKVAAEQAAAQVAAERAPTGA